jgi:hypothetical protein
MEIHPTEPLMLDHNPSDASITIAKLKRYKSPGSDQFAAELIQARGGKIMI